jgi:hypothetical protein
MRVTKIDAARRQLNTAIRLFFDGGGPVEAQVFQAWFIAVFPKKVSDDLVAQSILENVNIAFPGIATLAAPGQIEMGKRVLEIVDIVRISCDHFKSGAYGKLHGKK